MSFTVTFRDFLQGGGYVTAMVPFWLISVCAKTFWKFRGDCNFSATVGRVTLFFLSRIAFDPKV